MKTYSAISFLLLASCRAPVEMSSGEVTYFPLKTGIYQEYRVERTTFAIGETPRQMQTRIRRSVDSTFVLGGDQIFLVKYATRLADNVWRTDSSHAAWQTGGQIFEQENGNTILRMHAPAFENLRWNANLFNPLPEVMCEMKDVNASMQLGPHYFTKTITILRQEYSTLLSGKKYIEMYAEGVGLVKREIKNVKYCQSGDCIGKGIIESGWTELITLEKTGSK